MYPGQAAVTAVSSCVSDSAADYDRYFYYNIPGFKPKLFVTSQVFAFFDGMPKKIILFPSSLEVYCQNCSVKSIT